MKLEPAHVWVTRHEKVGYCRTAVSRRAWIKWRRRSAIQPMLDGGVAIRKRESSGTIMVHARHILTEGVETGIIRNVPRHVRLIITPIDAVLALIQKNPCITWPGRATDDQVRGFHINRVLVVRSFPTKSSQKKVHRDGADARQLSARVMDHRGVGRAAINPKGIDIRIKRPHRDVHRRIVILWIVSKILLLLAPGIPVQRVTGAAGLTGKDNILSVFLRIHAPAKHHLPHVAHALDAHALFLGALHGWQQKARQNGDDGNDHQQLDQGEGVVPVWMGPVLFVYNVLHAEREYY